VGTTPALAGPQVYTYSIVHPVYGDIGTLTDTIDRDFRTVEDETPIDFVLQNAAAAADAAPVAASKRHAPAAPTP